MFCEYNYLILDLQEKLTAAENEKQTIQEDFNTQRAKLKKLLLQKEGTTCIQ